MPSCDRLDHQRRAPHDVPAGEDLAGRGPAVLGPGQHQPAAVDLGQARPVGRVRAVADGLDHQGDLQGPGGALDLDRPAPAGGVRLPETGAQQAQALDPAGAVGHVAGGLVEQQEVHAQALGRLALVLLGRHLGVGAAVHQVDVAGAQLEGGLRAVHGHAAAADHGHGLAPDLPGQLLEAFLAQQGQEIHGGVYPLGLAPGRQPLRAPQAGGQEHGPEAGIQQLLRGPGALHAGVALELHAQVLQVLQLVFQEGLVEAVGGHPVADDAARLRALLEHRDLHALPRQLRGAGQPRRPGAHHGHLFGPRRGLLVGLEADLPAVLDQEALDLADLDGPADARGAALLLAQPRGGAEHAAGAAQGIVLLDGADRPGDVAQAQLADERARVGFRRAALGARWVMAKQATVRLGQGLGEVEPLFHFPELVRVAHGEPPGKKISPRPPEVGGGAN